MPVPVNIQRVRGGWLDGISRQTARWLAAAAAAISARRYTRLLFYTEYSTDRFAAKWDRVKPQVKPQVKQRLFFCDRVRRAWERVFAARRINWSFRVGSVETLNWLWGLESIVWEVCWCIVQCCCWSRNLVYRPCSWFSYALMLDGE